MMFHGDRAPERDDPAPERLNKYRLLAPLGRGGMAEVFLARAEGIRGFQRLLAVKRILPQFAGDAEFVRMFLDEARIAATLHHPNIVRVFEVDIADGQVFYVMEYLHGHSVAALLRRLADGGVRLPLDGAIAIAAAVAAGLHHAHDRRSADGDPLHIVHRDVAPGNVIMTYDGQVKLIDFGIVRAASNLHRTQFGVFRGKLPYASPEQCRCEPLDRRSDVFSLGVVLYELTCGQPPFAAGSEADLLRAVSEAQVARPRLADPSYPRELEAIVMKALAANPDERYPSARALQRDLKAVASQLQLDLSAIALSRLVASVFGPELQQWRDAERAGRTLEQYLTAGASPTPVTGPAALAPAGTERTAQELVRPAHAWRLRSQLVRVALIVVAAIGLIAAGAAGALWWTSRSAVVRGNTPAPATGSAEAPDRAP
jgi:serine/threonine protein kinase